MSLTDYQLSATDYQQIAYELRNRRSAATKSRKAEMMLCGRMAVFHADSADLERYVGKAYAAQKSELAAQHYSARAFRLSALLGGAA